MTIDEYSIKVYHNQLLSETVIQEDILMKATCSLLLVFLLSTACFAQFGDFTQLVKNNNWNYVVVSSAETEQDVVVLLCWKSIENEPGPLNYPQKRGYGPQFADQIIVKQDKMYDYLDARRKYLAEMVQYHEAIKRAKLKLTELKKERDEIMKKLDLMKNNLYKKNTLRLNRSKQY